MRLLLPPVALATTLIIPAVADASPFAVPTHGIQLIGAEPPADDPATDDADPADSSSEVPTGDQEALDEIATADPTEGEVTEDEDELEDELAAGKPKKGDFNANAIGVSGGIHLVPSYFLNQALASYGNSLCRNEV